MAAFLPVSVIDTFSRTNTDSWGSTDNGAPWIGETSIHDVSGGIATAVVSANSGYNAIYCRTTDIGVPLQGSSSEVLMLMRWTASSTYPHTDCGPILNRDGPGTFYYAVLQGNIAEVAIGVYIDGVRYELDRTSRTLNKNQWYWVRFQRSSGKLRLRVWNKDSTEPTAWTLETPVWNGINPPGNGYPGFFHKGTAETHTIEIDSYYFYTLEDEEPYLPFNDTFARAVHQGWGMSDSGHLWNGNISDNPNILTRNFKGSVSGGNGIIMPADAGVHAGIAGPDVSSNIEAYFEFQTNTATSTNAMEWWLGLYGNSSTSNGVFEVWGYALKLSGATTSVQLQKKTAAGGSWTNIGAAGAVPSLQANVVYKVRMQKEGTTIRARIWLGSTAEPGTWTVTATDSSITHGAIFWQIMNPAGFTRYLWIDRMDYQQFTPSVGTDYVTTGTPTVVTNTDTTIQVNFPYTNDTNNSSSVVVQYKKSTETTWKTITSTVNRTTKIFTSQLVTGLTPNTTYNFRATFSDSDGVVGTNPRIINVTTPELAATIGTLTVSNITPTGATLTLTRTGDTNNNSTATLERRTLGQMVTIASDDFSDPYGGLLESYTSSSGLTWTKFTSGNPAAVRLNRNRPYMETTEAGQIAVYYANIAPPSADYSVYADFMFNGQDGSLNLVGRLDTALGNWYYAGWIWDATVEQGYYRIVKLVNGVTTTLAVTDFVEVEYDRFYGIEFRMEGTLLRLFVDGVKVLETTDSSLSAAGRAGFRYVSTTNIADPLNTYPRLDNFRITQRSSIGSWGAGGTFVADHVNKRFVATVTGLASDTLYEFRATLADADGVNGTTQLTTTIQTVGNKVAFADTPISVAPYPTSATVTFYYLYDNDNDSTLSVQYRAAEEDIWITMPSSAVTKDSGSKTFTVSPTGLRAATTYEIRGILSDPDGILENSTDTAYGSFTTKAFLRVDQQLNKRYVWKVFSNETGEYLESWNDAGAPEFSYEENGGVSDLTVRLRRPISTILDPKTSIQYFNRVDVWVHDSFASGLGPNLIYDENLSFGSWTLGTDTTISGSGGVDGGKCLKILTNSTAPLKSYSEPIYVDPSPTINTDDFRNRTFIISVYARARLGKLVLSVEEYRDVESASSLLAVGPNTVETVGTEWQLLRIKHRVKDPRTEYIRIVVFNDGAGEMRVDTPSVRCEEMLVYSGNIEQISPFLTADSEYLDIQVLGDAARLSDTYVEWLQYVNVQTTNDFIIDPSSPNAPPNNRIYRPNNGSADPSTMLKGIVDATNVDNPKSRLYYIDGLSIKFTGADPVQYTFKEMQARACMDKVREMCPPGWHYFIEPDGQVTLRGPEHARTHVLRIGVEATKFDADNTIRNLKNYIYFKGRQDDDYSEPDGHGSIMATAFDQDSIDKYGKRMLYVRDAKVTDPATADTIAQGKLDELNRPEQRSKLTVLDEKSIIKNETGFKGYNIESFRPGDFVIILNPRAAPEYTYWDQAVWDESLWNSTSQIRVLTEPVPIKTIEYHDNHVVLQLSERAPSSVSDFGRMLRVLQKQQADTGE